MKIQDDVMKYFVRRIKSEGSGIADIHFYDSAAFFLQASRFDHDRATDVVADILQFCRLSDMVSQGLTARISLRISLTLDERTTAIR
jgi:PleD family two-component response regulator